ncbi:MAG TPA: hypothetical protein VFM46_16910, partial [Pseudomonadales bacterium]|nr:hypothetical protein [Pseudomonadales bacterium]
MSVMRRLGVAVSLTMLAACASAPTPPTPTPSAEATTVAAAPEPVRPALPQPTQQMVATAYRYDVAPVPAWVTQPKEPAQVSVEKAPLHYRLLEDQVRVTDTDVERYTHVVRVVNET